MRPFTATTVLLQPAGAGSNRHALWVEAGLNGIPANGSVDASLYASGHPSLSAAALRLHEGRWKRKPQHLSGASAAFSANENTRIKVGDLEALKVANMPREMYEWYGVHIA